MYKIGDKVKLKGTKTGGNTPWEKVKQYYPDMIGYVRFIYGDDNLDIYNSDRTEHWIFTPNDVEPFEEKCCHCICEQEVRKDERARVIEEIISKIKN